MTRVVCEGKGLKWSLSRQMMAAIDLHVVTILACIIASYKYVYATLSILIVSTYFHCFQDWHYLQYLFVRQRLK